VRYHQPFGVSDPDAGYINGNTATGVRGSIPPAAAIEYPQREIVAAISGCGLTPSDTNTQLFWALQLADVMNVLKKGTNGGTPTQWSMSCPALPIMPPPVGTTLWFKPGVPSQNGGTVFSVNGSAFAPVVCCDLSPLAVGDIVASAWLLLFYDGTNWQVIAGSTRQFGALPLLQANANWYVNGSTGNDTTFDGSAPTPGGGKIGPFKTLQRAADEVIKYNMNGYYQYINVTDGTYGSVICHPTNGSGRVFWQGNFSNPGNVSVVTAAYLTAAMSIAGGYYSVRGMRFSATGGGASDSLLVTGSADVQGRDLQFGPSSRYQLSVGSGANFIISGGTIFIEGGANAAAHIGVESSALCQSNPYDLPSLNILGSVNLNYFISSSVLGLGIIFYNSITGKANVHGAMYLALGNGIVSTSGHGATHLPGDTAGVLSTGGQFLP
jgi:hypothetical protein